MVLPPVLGSIPGQADGKGSGTEPSAVFVAMLTCAPYFLKGFFAGVTNQASLWKAMMSEAGGKEAEGWRRESLQLGRWTTGRLRVREILLETYLKRESETTLLENFHLLLASQVPRLT